MRLVKIAKQIDKSIKEIATFLSTIGINIDHKPTTILSDKTVSLVLDHFIKEKENLKDSALDKNVIAEDPLDDFDDLEIEKFVNTNIDIESELIDPPPFPLAQQPRTSNYSINWSKLIKFKFLVQRWMAGTNKGKYVNHMQLKGIFLGNENLSSEETAKIVRDFQFYFDYKGQAFKTLNLKKVYRDFPDFWNVPSSTDKYHQLVRGLKDEIYIQERNKSYVRCKILKKEKQSPSLFLYQAEVINEYDQNTQIQEEIILKVTKPFEAYIIVLEHNINKNILYFESKSEFHRYHTEITIEYNGAWILKRLLYRIENDLILDSNKVWTRIINVDNIESELLNSNPKLINSEISQLQSACAKHSITNDISFIWGPPGTGKTTTLAAILENLTSSGDRTLVCSIANVAVDALIIKYIKLLKDFSPNLYKSGAIIRAGSTFSEVILSEEKLFSHKHEIKNLKARIDELRLQFSGELNDTERMNIIRDLRETRRQIKNKQKDAYLKANTIFCTSAYSLFDEALMNVTFDNLIIDEASMMNIPYLLWLGRFTNKRIIVTGDFRQLGPISSAKSLFSEKWMKRDVFKLVSNDYNFKINGPVFQLNEQYRMNCKIMELINPFYNNQLKTIDTPSQHSYSGQLNTEPILYYPKKNGKVACAKSGSRYNQTTFDFITELIDKLILNIDEKPTIGIITPYREQANKYHNKYQDTELKIKPTCGTIHTFQGSECDIIIFDLVESMNDIDDKPNKISALFFDQDGERLINVAFSRAKSKLIIVGDIDAIVKSEPHLTSSIFKKVLQSIKSSYIP